MVNHVFFPKLGLGPIEIKRIAFSFFGLDVHWYALLITIGLMLSFMLALRHAKYYGLSADTVNELLLVSVPTGLIGARLYYVLFSWSQFKEDPLSIFNLRSGGLAFYGAVIGVVLGLSIYARLKKEALLPYLDFLIVYLPLGQAIGRWGNFVNQEAFGTNTHLPWGMISERTQAYLAQLDKSLYPGLDPHLPVHPTFLYESLGNILIFLLLLYVRKHSQYRFSTVASYLLSYGVLRFFVEGVRTDALFIGSTSLRVSQVLSLLMVFAGFATLAYFTFAKPHFFLKNSMPESEKEAHVELEVEPIEVGDEQVLPSSTNKNTALLEASENQKEESKT